MPPKKNGSSNARLWEQQAAALRDPAEVLCAPYAPSGLSPKSLTTTMDDGFRTLLRRLDITLFITREYEHLVLALSPEGKGKIRQSFVHLPHPSGLAVDHKRQSVFIAATRNPNQVWEFKPANGRLPRTDVPAATDVPKGALIPTRTKVLAGAYYLHDLALIGGELHGNSVGQNAVVRIDMDTAEPPPVVWRPKCVEETMPHAPHGCNYLQLNSIAAGSTLAKSFFSASGDVPGRIRPGHPDYPVDQRGVIFSGQLRTAVARGLTRPHSARLSHGRVWVDNSGYGEFGWIGKGIFHPIVTLPGWTRGLCIVGDVAFVGVSQILPRFRQYAPGVDARKARCGIYAISLPSGKILGACRFPAGNQIFAIDQMARSICPGFPFTRLAPSSPALSQFFYQAIT
ncbi:MAG: hypothetical protein RL141_645 [Candidatus Parcubacteria bacterium]|jgi:uncharacterized protein (TIGR03032 family)